jgi:plastocyanin
MLVSVTNARSERLFGWVLAGALVAGLIAGVLIPRLTVQAQDLEPQTYTAFAGGDTSYNTTVLAFAPQRLQVHRGDTVTWLVAGFHNIHFTDGPTELVIMPEVNGQPLPQMNPAVAFPSVDSGSVYQGADTNSGLPLDPANPMVAFSLVMDVEPGTYGYYCDVHPGMVGAIEVVDDATAIPSPDEALVAGAAELAASKGQGIQAAVQTAMQAPTEAEGGGLQVQAGLQAGVAAVLDFFPSVAVIEAGQSVSWNVAPGMEPHTVTWPTLPPGSEVTLIPQDSGAPILALGEAAFPSVESGAEIGTGDPFNSGIMFPGQSFTLRFNEPGVYNYVCFLHPGMQGGVVVMPTA